MSDKQRLQVNNTNLSTIFSEIGDLPLKALVEAAAREGQYVWKKLTAQGGTFLDYVVNDSETAYPDGGMQDGYWYEMPKPASDIPDLVSIMIERFGYTKKAVDKFTYTAQTQLSTNFNNAPTKIAHSLGVVPKAFIITANRIADYQGNMNAAWGSAVQLVASRHNEFQTAAGETSASYVGDCSWFPARNNGEIASLNNIGVKTATASSISIAHKNTYQYLYFPAGVEYTLITMA